MERFQYGGVTDAGQDLSGLVRLIHAAVEFLLARQINGLASDVQRQGSTARRSGNRLSWATDTIDFWSVAKSVSSGHCTTGLLNGKGFIFVLVVGNDHR